MFVILVFLVLCTKQSCHFACNMTPDAQPFENHCDIWTKGFEEVHEVKREANLHINVSLR